MARSTPAMKTDAPANKPPTGLAKFNADRKAVKEAAAAAKANGTVLVDPKLEAASHIAHGTTPESEAAAEEPEVLDEVADNLSNATMDSLMEAIHSVKPTFRQTLGQDEHAFVTQMVLIVQDLPEETYDAMTPEAIAWYEEQCNKAAYRTLPVGVVFVPVDQEADPVPAKRGRPAAAASTAPKAPATAKAVKPAKEKKAKESTKRDPELSKTTMISRFVIKNPECGAADVKAHMAKLGQVVQDATIAAQMTQTKGVVRLLKVMGHWKD